MAGTVQIAADAPIGDRYVLLRTAQGITTPLRFVIGSLPEVVEEEIDTVDLRKNASEAAAARAANERPVGPQLFRNRCADLRVKIEVDQRGLIDAEEATEPVPTQRSKDHRCRDAAADAGLDDASRS